MPNVIVFDLMGTLLNYQALDTYFERFFGDAAVRKEWSTQTIQLAMAAMLTNAVPRSRWRRKAATASLIPGFWACASWC